MPESLFQYQGNRFAPGANLWPNARSESIWWDCPYERIANGEVAGTVRFYDFSNFKPAANVNAAEALWDKGLSCFGSDGFAITAVDGVGGGVTIGSDGDNEGGSFHELGAPWQLSRSTSDLWFEVMFSTSTVADTTHNVFTGLAATTAFSATVPITATGTIADTGVVGFFRPETARTTAGTGGAIMNTVYKAAGVTAVTVQSDACTLAANTLTKLGIRYKGANVDKDVQGAASNAKYLQSFYQDGRRLTGYKQMPTGAGTDFPNNVRLGFFFAVLNATGTAPGTCTLRWARIAQLL
jgi:hypothetical protein